MEVTEVKVFPLRKPNDKLKAFATIVFDSCFIIRDLKVINGNSGLFVAMPSRKLEDGTYEDIVHPINSETRQKIEQAVLEEYERAKDRRGRQSFRKRDSESALIEPPSLPSAQQDTPADSQSLSAGGIELL